MTETTTETASARGRKPSRKSEPATSTTTTPDASAESKTNGSEGSQSYSATLRLPFLTAHLEVPKPSRPHLPAVKTPDLSQPVHVGPVAVPAPPKTIYYLGLGALAGAEVVEWPVAAAIAAGTYIAQHTRGDAPTAPRIERDEAPQASA